MSISIQEKVDQLTTNLMEVAGIPDTVAGMYNKLDQNTKNILFPDVEGMRKYPGSLQNITFRGLLDLGDAARKRGAGEGAALGAAGGAALGAGVASGGVPKIYSDTVGGFKKGLKSGSTAKGKLGGALVRGLMGLGTSTAKAAGMGAGGSILGGLGGGIAGFRGGRQAGAAIAGAGTVGGPLGVVAGPLGGAAGAFAGGGIGSDIAKSYVRSKKGLQVGGDPYNLVFKQ